MDAFLAQAKSLAATVDEAGRKKLLDTVRGLAFSLESHQDSAERLFHVVRKLNHNYLYDLSHIFKSNFKSLLYASALTSNCSIFSVILQIL